MGFEPITTALSTQHSNQLSQDPYLKGLEPSTTALSTQHSIQLSYDPNLVKGLLPLVPRLCRPVGLKVGGRAWTDSNRHLST